MNIKELKLKYTQRAVIIFEEITGQPLKLDNNKNILIFYYCVLIANNRDVNLTFDDFIDVVDDDDTLLPYMNNWFAGEIAKRSIFPSKEKEEEDAKKK